MFDKLGVSWACSVLGFATLALLPVPFVFLRWGKGLRMRSPFCRRLREGKEGAGEGGNQGEEEEAYGQ